MGSSLTLLASLVSIAVKEKKSLTITEPEMTRFMMSLDDSVRLVLFAFENAQPGDIFVQKSPAATIFTLATALKEIFNSTSEIKIIGARHGEKMFETLCGKEEMSKADLPLPVVLDVTLKQGVTVDIPKLQAALSLLAPGTEVDTHEAWVSAFISFSTAIRTVITMFAVLIVVSIALMIAFTSRASLHLHKKAVHLLHSVGAEDKYIARQFQHEACMVTMRGASAGCAIAALGFWGMGFYMQSLGNPSIPSLAMGKTHFILLASVALSCGIVAWATARISVLKQLKQML